jgi:hypothetical protein
MNHVGLPGSSENVKDQLNEPYSNQHRYYDPNNLEYPTRLWSAELGLQDGKDGPESPQQYQANQQTQNDTE